MTQNTERNRDALRNLDKKRYPALYKMLFVFLNGKLFRALEYYWFAQDTIENPHLHPDGYREFFESRRYSAENSTKHGFKVSENHWDWHRYTILLHCIGLISTRRYWYEKGQRLPDIKEKAIERMKKQGHRYPITYITTEKWTPESLEYSEAQAMKWVSARLPIRFVTKEAIIRVYGQSLADQIFNDKRGISQESEKQQRKLSKTVARASKSKGYTTKRQVLTLLTNEIGRYKAERVWALYQKQVLSDSGYRYHRPTNADKARHGIKQTDNRWIIDRVDENNRTKPPQVEETTLPF